MPFDETAEIWTVRLRNLSQRPRKLSLFTYLEWCLGAGPDVHREFHKIFLETAFSRELHGILARKHIWEIPSPRGHWNTDWWGVAFFLCSEPPDGFETDKESFLGRHGSPARPQALQGTGLSGTDGRWNDAIAALQKSVELPPGGEAELQFFLGAGPTAEDVARTAERLSRPGAVEEQFRAMQRRWEELFRGTAVETPDPATNVMLNIWLKYQAVSGRLWGRAAYYQQSGAYGFRDQLQDSQIFLYLRPELTRRQIQLHARHQFPDGRALHWWHPITEEGLDGGMSDDLLWLPFVTVQYLKETADWAFLDEPLPFYRTKEEAPLLEHCTRAIDLVLGRRGEHGLPLILAGDWNDGLSAMGLEGRGESVWLGQFLFHVLREFVLLLQRMGLMEKAEIYQREAAALRQAVNASGWDGRWYWRATKDSGERLGSRTNRFGRIFLNPQTWAVISGIAPPERRRELLRVIQEELESDYGTLLLRPAFREPDTEIGYLSRYAPGVRENGGVYTHAATWAIWAACAEKEAELAFRLYRKILPPENAREIGRYLAEPYVTPGNIDGPDSPHYGRGGWTWYTGSAAWLFRVVLDHLLGVRADYDGLVIDPCLPPGWKEVTVRRLFRGCRYEIALRSSGKPGARPVEILVDGEPQAGNLIPEQRDKERVSVSVRLE